MSSRNARRICLSRLSLLVLVLVVVPVASATPMLDYFTLIGGSAGDGAVGVAVDDAGYVYICGSTSSTDFYVTTSTPHAGRAEAFIAKLDPMGTPVFSTYFGGNHNDSCHDLEIDDEGHVYIVGETKSTNLPTTAGDQMGFQTNFGGTRDAYVAKFDLDRPSPLIYVSYLGGSGDEATPTLAVDPTGAAYVAVRTTGSFPVGPGFDTSFNGGTWDWTVTKVSPTGSVKEWATYLGGSDREQLQPHIAVDAAGSAYLASSTISSNYPIAGTGVIQPIDLNGAGNFRDTPVVTKLAPDGLSLEFSTYFGTSDGAREAINSIEVDVATTDFDGDGDLDPHIYVAGAFNGSDFPGTTGLDPAANEIFVSKIDPLGQSVVYTTPLGTGAARSIDVGSTGNVSLCGEAFNPIPEVDPIQNGFAGHRDMVLAHLDASGTATFASLFGSASDDGSCFQAMDPVGNLYGISGVRDVATWPLAPSFSYFTPSGGLMLVDAGIFRISGVGVATDPALVAYAALDENAGVIADFGQGLSGDLTGGATWFDYGQQGSAVEFDGTTGYIEVVDAGNSPLDVTTLTVAAWVRPDAVGSGTQSLVSKDDAYELELGRNFPYDEWELRIDNGSPGSANTPVQEGVWQHLAATWDGATIHYYRNGQPDGSVAHAAAIDPMTHENLGIGARPTAAASGGPTYFFEGAMDEVRVYSRVLAAGEIQALFDDSVTDIAAPARSNGSPDGVVAAAPVTLGLDTDETAHCRFGESAAGTRYADLPSAFANTDATSHDSSFSPAGSTALVQVRCRDLYGNTNTSDFAIGVGIGASDISVGLQGEWLFEEGSGCSTEDETANTQTGDLSNTLGTCDAADDSPQWQANEADAMPGPCFSGGCLSFDGNDRVSATLVEALRVNPQELTVSAWVRHDAITGNYSMIADLRGTDVDSGLLVGYALALNTSGKGYFKVRGTVVETLVDLDDGRWHHLVGVWKRNPDGTGFTRIYVDGLLDSTGASAGSFNLGATTQLQIGHRFNAGETMHNFKGEIDTVSIYDRELSDLEVFDLYLATRP